MNITDAGLPGVKLLSPTRISDDRGFFSETFRQDVLTAHGIAVSFVQDNHSHSTAEGVVRGLHFQSPPFAQAKLVRVVRGRILDVVVDIRRGSPTYGRHLSVELSAENWQQLLVPAGFAHGFCTLAPGCEVLYKVDAYYSAAHDRGLLWNDPALGIDWPVTPDAVILSDRDRRHPTLAALDSPFHYSEEQAA
ncbi:dTDP-4-dehydrorhamnose 3,5-epimerase [Pseudorhodoplanes sp.]|uniref:dTDP-4-dehydrorhamnose 3,5-epimerase n=1 Tax=Pseudorhodoplanes sp. TaxID=1934341 RepID=UPI002C5D6A18|nr:dTDP-4-dehydrorhamnose 3,5-epimerase [Pseudorhodoplanes sp.]HWV43440.1 dTDP-4-dehydrorhamnose 3,5-epimerase [Pseudorhodoplanes sp.]